MIDTIKLGYKIELSNDQLYELFENRSRHPKYDYLKLKYSLRIKLPEGNTCQLTYHPFNMMREPDPLLLIEFSIPRFVHGTNLFPVYDYAQMVDISNELLAYIDFLPRLDVREGAVYRIDLVYNHQVGEYLTFFKKAFPLLHYPHRKTKPYLDQGTLFFSKYDSAMFYDKELKSKDPRAHGVWRHERRLAQFGILKEITGMDCPRLIDFTPDLVAKLLTEDLERLKLVDQKICGIDYAMKLLTDKWGTKKADMLHGFLMRNQGLDRKDVYKNYKGKTRTVDRRFDDIHDAGVSIAIDENKTTLPPLTIDFGPEVSQSLKGSENVSDTIDFGPEVSQSLKGSENVSDTIETWSSCTSIENHSERTLHRSTQFRLKKSQLPQWQIRTICQTISLKINH